MKQELMQDKKETRHKPTALFQRFYKLAQSVLTAIWSKSWVGLPYYILMQVSSGLVEGEDLKAELQGGASRDRQRSQVPSSGKDAPERQVS